MPGLTPSSPINASGTARGLVSTIAQIFAGVKTFLALAVFSAGVQLSLLFGTNGGSAADVVLKVGTSLADASVHASAKLFSVRTGLNGGTEVEQAYITKSGALALLGGLTVSGYPNSIITCSGSWIDVGNGLPVRTNSYFASSTPAGSTAYYASAGGAFSALNRMTMWSEAASGASDVAHRRGCYVADASVNASCKLDQWGTGLGGTFVEKGFIIKDGTIELTGAGVGIVMKSPDGTRYRLTVSNAGALVIAAA